MADDPWGIAQPVSNNKDADPWGVAGTAPVKQSDDDDMPSTWQALGQGLGAAYEQAKQSGEAISGQPVQEAPETSPAAQPFGWSDITSPSHILPKAAYQLAKSSPTLAAGVAGGAVGGMAGSAIEPGGGTAVGGLAGGAMGAAAGAAFQEIGPAFATELKKTPQDPNGAWDRAMHEAEISGAFSGIGWSLFPARFFSGPVKNLAFQALGVQPGVNVAEQATRNLVEGKPAGDNLGQAYVQGAVGTGIPLVGHHLLAGRSEAPTPQEKPAAPIEATKPTEQMELFGDKVAPDMAATHQEIDQKLPPEPEIKEPSLWDKVPGVTQTKAIVDGFKRTFAPEQMSELSLQSEGIFREFNDAKAQQKDSIVHYFDKMHNEFEKLPEDQRIAFIKGMGNEEGVQIPPNLKPYEPVLKQLLKQTWEGDKNVGSKMGYIQDYFPREFVKPEDAAKYIQNRVQSLGPKWFQKARTNDLLQEGLDAGLQLRTTNPIDLVTNRLLSSVDMRERVRLLQRLDEIGAAARVTPDNAQAYVRAGWQLVKDPVGTDYAVHPDVQPLWKNVIDSQGLWQNEGLAGRGFRKWMTMKNAWVPLKLALSGFHPLHVAGINLADGLTRGWTRLKSGDVPGAVQSALEGVYGQIQAAIPYVPHKGKEARAAWLTPEWRQTPEQKATIKLMTEGGFSPQLSEQLRMKGHRAFNDALAHQDYLRAGFYGITNGFRAMQAAIFEHWIPSLKTAAYLNEAKALFERRPDLIDNTTLRRAALGAIAKSVDNRFGEMFYSNLFWNKTLKDAGIGSFLSLGWNLGFVREFGGGALEPFMRPLLEQNATRQAINAAKSKSAFAFFYVATSMMFAGLMTKALTGENPSDFMDYILPRISGNNPDGSPRRLSTMFYTREIPMAAKHIEERGGNVLAGLKEMLWNKMMFEPFNEIKNNRDYYGYNITDENAPWYQRAYQLGHYILSDQFNPITITGSKRALQASGKWDDSGSWQSYVNNFKSIMSQREGQLAMAGFGPAPTYASKTPAQNRLNMLYEQYVAPQERPMVDREVMEQRRDARAALLLAQQQKDNAKIEAAATRLANLGMTSSQIKKVQPGVADLYQFQRLRPAIQQSFLKDLSKEDFMRYYPKASKKTKGDPDIERRARKYYGN